MYCHVIFLVTAMYFLCTPFPTLMPTGVVTHSCPWYVFLCALNNSRHSFEEWQSYIFHHSLFHVPYFEWPVHQIVFFILFQGLAPLWQKPQCQLKSIAFSRINEWPKRWHTLGCPDIAEMTLIWTVMAHGMECLCVQCWSHQWTRLAWNSTMGHCLFDQWHAIQALHQGMFQLSIGFVKVFVPFHLHSLVGLSSCIFWFLSSLGVIIWHSSYGAPSWKQGRYNEFETLVGYDILPIFSHQIQFIHQFW